DDVPVIHARCDLRQALVEAEGAEVDADAPVALRDPLGDRPPGVAALREARKECDERIHSHMIPINRTFAPLQAFVDELVRCGLHHAVTSPGSRNAPLILTLAGHPGLDCVSVIDERSAGFVALGIAKATRRPVAITCTSGTAAANLAPAVIEAREASVP